MSFLCCALQNWVGSKGDMAILGCPFYFLICLIYSCSNFDKFAVINFINSCLDGFTAITLHVSS